MPPRDHGPIAITFDQARREGIRAAAEGQPHTANPYGLGYGGPAWEAQAHDGWLSGWRAHFGDCQPYLDAHRRKSAGSGETLQEEDDAREPPHRDRHTDGHGRPWYGR